jgi:transcriptional/translational regulatory protein YebC/TACO1
MMAGLEHGADDLSEDLNDNGDPVWVVICEVGDLETLREGLEGEGVELQEYGLTWIPVLTVPVEGAVADKIFALIELLEDNDDVQNVHANLEISDEEMERIAAP